MKLKVKHMLWTKSISYPEVFTQLLYTEKYTPDL